MKMLKLAISILISLALFSVGFFLGNSAFLKHEKCQDIGWSVAQERLAKLGYYIPNQDIAAVDGIITKIENNSIELSINPLEPLANPWLDSRIVKIDSNTKIYQIKSRTDTAEYKNEIIVYNKKVENLMKNPKAQSEEYRELVAPLPFTKEVANISDLKQQLLINVIAGFNIKDAKEFLAEEIDIQMGK